MAMGLKLPELENSKALSIVDVTLGCDTMGQ